jgi:hypothetical protein
MNPLKMKSGVDLRIMRVALCVLFVVPACVLGAGAQTRRTRTPPYGLPSGAVVVETRALELGGAKKRALVLWMLRPKKFPRDEREIYTCPEETRGSYYQGPARVSLVDTGTRRVVNTVVITDEHMEGQDTFDLPYRIHAGSYYHVPGAAEGVEGRPEIMWLRDYNGDGEALEFALFDAVACMPVETTLVGYSRARDKVIQYPISVEYEEGGKRSSEVRFWMDYLFTKKPESPGLWKYDVDYRGRGGTLDKHEIRYDAAREVFYGKVVSVGDEQ